MSNRSHIEDVSLERSYCTETSCYAIAPCSAHPSQRQSTSHSEPAQMMTLYQYEHCPYCRRCVMLLKLKGVGSDRVRIRTVAYDDEKTVMDLHPSHEHILPLLDTGKKVVAESLDIMQFLDQNFGLPLLTGEPLLGLDEWLERLNGPSIYLLLPGWYAKAERYEDLRATSSREYFRKYKEPQIREIAESEGAQFDTFDKCFANAASLRKEVEQILKDIPVTWVSAPLGVDHVVLWAELDALSVIDGLQLPEQARQFMKRFP